MIKLLRVDHRLLHGQVAVSWKGALDADCILIANDAVPTDALRKSALKVAKPAGTKLVIKTIADSIEAINSGVTDKYSLLIVVESIADAAKLCRGCKISVVNLGGTKVRPGTRNISKAMNITEEEAGILRELVSEGVQVEIQMVPDDSPVDVMRVL
ncbi:PTS sugar transporter subunit IIB [Collinsella sp. AGMB00827]|uniref:PTS sugar transporter subunit IIB n=1 Tax=Collinsella ureilytica TaxID=2869515 RepID=A0ABS7MKH8_9ACTN|nr:PTS sugar transporter subunit IIB [Collinsella urealyticum]MBY4797876.1 PTS sugar transporter subunit IIB [Collinsella urealyticum]